MWSNKQYDIMPNQYHHFYENGDTLIYPEHIQDLLVIDRMWNNRIKRERQKEEAKNQIKSNNNPLKQHHNNNNTATSIQNKQRSGGFYNQTYKYK